MIENILKAREQRWRKRCALAEEFALPVVSITVNIPGPEKVRDIYLKAHSVIVDVFEKKLEELAGALVVYREENIGYDGPETFLVIKGDTWYLKSLALQIEEKHPLGRLADIDVMDKDKNVLTRKSMNRPERTCIVCGHIARSCIVMGRHSFREVLEEVHMILRNNLEKR